MSDTNPTTVEAARPPERDIPALRQVRESAQALLRAGKTEETWELLLSTLGAS